MNQSQIIRPSPLDGLACGARFLAAALMFVVAACETVGGSSGGHFPPMSREEVVGTWSLTDSENELFNVLISADGSAINTWWKGEDGAKGERGRWELVNGALDLRFSSGWRDVISRSKIGYRKIAYAPGLSPGSRTSNEPANDGQAMKVVGDDLQFVGVWIIPGALAGPKYELYVALRSDGMAMKSVDAINQGTWQIESGIAHLYWADGWHTTLEMVDAVDYFSKSWKPGVAITEMPTGAAPVRRVLK